MVQRTATVDHVTVEKVLKRSVERRIKVHPVPFIWQGLGFASAWKTHPARMYCANCEVSWRWGYAVGYFALYGMEPLVAIPGRLNAETYCTNFDNHALPMLWQFYGMDPCYFQDDNAVCHVARAIMA